MLPSWHPSNHPYMKETRQAHPHMGNTTHVLAHVFIWQKPYLQVQVTKPMVIFHADEVNRMHAHIVHACSHCACKLPCARHIHTNTACMHATCTPLQHDDFAHANSHPHIALSKAAHLGDLSVAQLRTIHAWPNQAKMSKDLCWRSH